MKPSMSAAVILVTTALRPSRPRRRRAALRSGSLDCLVCREVGPACAQWAAMLISGGDCCFARPPASGKRSTAGGTELRFSSLANASGPSQFATKRNKWERLVTKCFEMLGNVSECSARNDLLPRLSCHRRLPLDPLSLLQIYAKICIILSTFA